MPLVQNFIYSQQPLHPMPYHLAREDLEVFLGSLGAYEVHAPVEKDGVVVFKRFEDGDRIEIGRNAYYPPKKLFLPQQEDMYSYRQVRVLTLSMERAESRVQNKRRILFGIRLCDLKAIQLMDRLYLAEPSDPFYRANRENTVIIALRCNKPGENCFCDSMGIVDKGYDILFEERYNGFIVETYSKVGEKLIDNRLFQQTAEKIGKHPKCRIQTKPAKLPEKHPVYDRNAVKCLTCQACNIVCPTCGCFSFRDLPNLNLHTGKRTRVWDYCQGSGFSSGEKPRDIKERYAHRLLCKFNYFKDNIGDYTCTGCGRCKTACLSGICDIPKIMEEVR